MGHTVVGVTSAQDAWEAIRNNGEPDVMVLDIVMHGTSGIELLRKLRDRPGLAELPVILLTARDLDDDVKVARELHADLMQKPIELASLTRALNRALAPT